MSSVSALPPAVRAYVQEFALRGRRLAVLRAAGAAAAVFLGWALLCCLADRFVQFPWWARLAMLIGGAVAAGALLVGPVVRALRREDDWVNVAERIERQNPRFGQRLVTVTSRLLGRPEYRGSDEILEHLVYELDRQAAGENASRLLPLRSVVAAWGAVLLAALSAVALARVPDLNLPRLAHRFLVPLADVPQVTTTRLAVSPGDRDVPQGAPLTIEATAERLGDATPWLYLSDDGGTNWSRSGMSWAGDGHYTFALPSVERDQWYYVAGGDATTRRYAVRVLRRPAVAEFHIRYAYPPYTGRPPQSVANSDGVIEAPVGTVATVTITATEPLQSALLTANGEKVLMSRAAPEGDGDGDADADGAASPGTSADNVRQARLTVLKQGPYQVDLISTREQAGAGPNTMFIRAIPDRSPVVRLLGPADDVRAGPRDVVPIAYEAIDDYGLNSIALRAQASAGPAVDVPVESFGSRRPESAGPPAPDDDSAGPATRSDAPPPPAPRRREGVVHVDLATMPLAVGDVLTLTLTARDTAGNAAQGAPVRVLVAPHAMDPRAAERIGETEAAAQWADALVTELEAAAKALDEASSEPTPAVGGMPGSGGSQSSGAAGRVNRRLASAIEAGAAVRRALLRATACVDGPKFAVATAGWVDAAQSVSSSAQSVFRGGLDSSTDRSTAAEVLRQNLQRARDLRADLVTVARGLRAEALLADRDNLAAAARRPAPNDPRAADLLNKTLDRVREEIAAGARVVGLDAGAGDLDAKLKGLADAGRSLTASRQPVNFAAASRAWAEQVKRDPARPDGLDERLASAAQQEAVRPDADLVRARDLQLAARAAARLATAAAAGQHGAKLSSGAAGGGSSNKASATQRDCDEFAKAIDAVQREHRQDRDRSGPNSTDQTSSVHAAAEHARGMLARLAGEPLLTDGGTVPAPASTSPATPVSRAARAEAIALAAGARAAARDYDRAAALDRALNRQLGALVSTSTASATATGVTPALPDTTAPTAAATTTADTVAAHPSASVEQQAEQQRAEVERAGRNVRRSMALAEQIDGVSAEQHGLVHETRGAAERGADEAAAASLAERQRAVASRVAEIVRQANPTSEPATVSLATTVPAPDDPNTRERGTAALVAAQQQLAAMPQQLTLVSEAAAAWREAARRAKSAKHEAEAAPPDRKAAAAMSAAQAERNAADAAARVDAAVQPVNAAAAQGMAGALRPYAPEASAAQEVVTGQLLPALEALASAAKSPDDGAVDRAAGQARQAVEAAQHEIARAEDAFAERDPLVAAKWFARAAADALGRKPPDYRSAQVHQDRTERALARSWDLSIHRAAAQRLAALPSMRPVLAVVPPADALAPGAAPPARPGASPSPAGVAARDWRRLRPREPDETNTSFRDSAPPEYEAALDLYFKALNKGRDGGK